MHVFVTGATGFVGFHTVKALLAAGHSVHLGVRNAEKMQQLYGRHGIEIKHYTVGQITDRVSVGAALDECDAVVHTAALVSNKLVDVDRMHQVNVLGTQCVIGGAVERGIKAIVYISSAVVLWNPSLSRIDESTPIALATTAYARTKVEAEQYVEELCNKGAKITLIYPPGIIGPDDPGLSESNEALQFLIKKFHVDTGGGLQLIDVRELAAAIVQLLEQRKSGRYLISGHHVTWRNLGNLLADAVSQPIRRVPIPAPILRGMGAIVETLNKIVPLNVPMSRESTALATRWVVNDDSKVHKELGIEYRPLHETLKDVVSWLVKEGHLDPKWIANMRPKK